MKNNTDQTKTPDDSSSRSSVQVWNRNFTFLISATVCGAAGGIAAGYALSFLVFYETESVFLSALILLGRLIPSFFLPLLAGPILDRFSRSKVLVFSDFANGILYLILGIWLCFWEFSYTAYLLYSIILGCAACLDELAYDAVAPMTMTPGSEQKSYAVSALVYPTLNVIMMPMAGVVMNAVGIPALLLAQGVLSLIAALLDAQIRVVQNRSSEKKGFSFKAWKSDLVETFEYLRQESGLLSMFSYSAVSSGLTNACAPSLIAFFSITPGFNAIMYSFFSVAECLGRMLGSGRQYLFHMKAKTCYRFSVFALLTYHILDGILLLTSYPLMLVNRFMVGALGSTTYTVRTAAIQAYIPDEMRGRINSFQFILFYVMTGIMVLIFGFLGDLVSPQRVMAIASLTGILCLSLTWIRNKKGSEKVFIEGVKD